MKPSFALDFRDGLIALLHRTSRGWSQVGASPVDAADLGEALTYMRSTALGLSPRGLTTKLVIPNDLILYTTVHAPGPEVAKRRRQIKTALEGLTPYKVDDLVFDWWGSGSEVQVAVVARETLAEAEAFAVEHRFNPVSFVGAPENGYMGEPFFGPSALSATLLSDGEKVERDQDPVSVVARDYVKPPEAPVAAPAPVVAEPPAPEPEPEPAPVAAQPEPVPPPAAPEPVQAEAPVASTFDPHALAVDLVDEAPMAVDVAEEPAPMAARLSEPPVTARASEPPVTAKTTEPPVTAKPAEPPVSAKMTEPPVTAKLTESPVRAPVVDAVADDVPPSPASAVISAFASRRTSAGEPAETTRKAPNLGPAPQQRPAVPRPTLAKPPAPLPSATRDGTLPFPGKVAAAAAKFSPGKASRPMVSAPNALAAKRDKNVVQLPAAAAGTEPPAEGKAAKGATGLDGRPVPPRGKPRYLGLILTGLLLVALALVAAWSSFYLTSEKVDPNAVPAANAVATATPDAALVADPTAAADATADAAPADNGAAVPSIADEALADGADPALADPAVAGSATVAEAAAPAPTPEPAPKTTLTTEAVAANTLGNDPQDEIFLADTDTPPKTSDPLVLPQLVASNDPPPEKSAPPPPFGTLYTFDAEGRIQPTPEGVITPEGVTLVAGSPKVVPPTRPAALTAPVAAALPETAVPETAAAETAAADPVGADPALADKRPKSRPAGLVDPAATTAKQGEALAPDANSRFASLRPQARPAALTTVPATQATQAAQAPADAELTNTAAASLALNGVQPSSQAVITSKKPAARPSGMDQAVDAAVAAAARTPEPKAEPQQDQVAAAAPEAQSEPEVEHSAPALPTNASVAKQATVKDAINLNRVALLGIFGTASGRYAMIRQPTGGVKKVKVGDRIDGGQIAAITQNEVQYQKGGRMVTLSLPTG